LRSRCEQRARHTPGRRWQWALGGAALLLALAAPALAGGAIYTFTDGNGVIRVIGDPPGGAIFIDSFESGDTSMWSTSVP